MVAGMGWLMDLCPQPDDFAIVEMCAQFGVLPSRLTSEDWRWLGIHSARRWLVASYQQWNQVASGEGSMSQDVVNHLIGLYEEAQQRWRTSDSD